MFKAKAKAGDGRTLVLLGLTDENLKRLKQGQPIDIDTSVLQVAPGETVGHICIFYGKDEASIGRELESLIGPQTIVHAIGAPPERPQ